MATNKKPVTKKVTNTGSKSEVYVEASASTRKSLHTQHKNRIIREARLELDKGGVLGRERALARLQRGVKELDSGILRLI